MKMLQRPAHRPHCFTVQPKPIPSQLSHAPFRQQQRCRCSAGDAAAAPQEETKLEMPEQPNQMNIPTPLGPDEPPQEEPKKLSPHARLSENLNSTSITIIGDDTELNWAVCQALSKKIGWFPVSTTKILLGMHKADSIQEILDKEGRDALAKSEAGILRGMKDQFRCCIATVGDGAAADASLYSNLFGTIIIWLDEQDKRSPKPNSAARSVYREKAEVHATIQKPAGGFGEKSVSLEDKAQRATGPLIKTMNKLLKEDSSLPARKRLYIEYGCRGDWPEIKPQEWNPVLEGLERKPVVEA